ncbi:MAG: serine protein kinase RIO [Deltaproteobacteria bacterium]|nr:serine protein kinase RIO [Deltaproteobacteria bacterium]
MKTPNQLIPLIHANLIDEVVGQLQSGKEAAVYVVLANGAYCCAKVYKEANNRTFKQKTQYTEGRRVRGSRQARAMEKNSRYGREERESEWQNKEVEALGALSNAGVLVPKVYAYYEGVLLLEMILDDEGDPAPRLNDVVTTRDQALEYHQTLMRQIVMMLCAGLVHGDLSEFNVLKSSKGLVIIDFPQVVQATANNAFAILQRDIKQVTHYCGRFAPEVLKTDYAREIWQLYQNGKLRPDSPITGKFAQSSKPINIGAILDEIDDAREDALKNHRSKQS